MHDQAQSKKLRAETLLARIEASMIPVSPSDDLETITDEERFTFRRIGLSMKAYLPLGEYPWFLSNTSSLMLCCEQITRQSIFYGIFFFIVTYVVIIL